MRRQVLHEDRCGECNEEAETSGHLFWNCPRAKEVCQCTKLHFVFEPSSIRSFFDLMWNLLMSDSYDEDKVAMVVTIAWSIWFNRNEVRHRGSKKSGVALVQWTTQYLEEYSAANCLPAMTPMIQVVGWSPPPMLRCKINVDGAIFKAHEAVGVGNLIRDSHGQVVAALSKKINARL